MKGGKAKQEEKEEKRKADLARKAENARLLAAEEAAVAAKPKKKITKDIKPAGPGAIAADGDLSPELTSSKVEDSESAVESYAATGIDNALDLLEVVTAKMDKASVGQQAADLERHPEVSIFMICIPKNNVNEIHSAGSRYFSASLIQFDLFILFRLCTKRIKNVNFRISSKR